MEKKPNIYQRIVEVMKEVTYVQKESKRVNNQYTFVSHDAVSAALHVPMAKQGIVMIPSIADLRQDGNRTEVKMEIAFVNCDDPSDRIVITQYGYGIDPQDKGIGKAQSYAVKYALLKLFCLETGDDVEKDNIDYQPAQKLDPVFLDKAAKDRQYEMLCLAGDENADKLELFFNNIRKTFKDKKFEEVILSMPKEELFLKFKNWLTKNVKVA